MGIPSGWELVLLLGVIVVLFGATKLPTAARSIGQSMRIFKAETKGLRSDEGKSDGDKDAGAKSAPPTSAAPAQETPSLPPTTPQATPPVEQVQNPTDTPR